LKCSTINDVRVVGSIDVAPRHAVVRFLAIACHKKDFTVVALAIQVRLSLNFLSKCQPDFLGLGPVADHCIEQVQLRTEVLISVG
jgi:hypothetical protein